MPSVRRSCSTTRRGPATTVRRPWCSRPTSRSAFSANPIRSPPSPLECKANKESSQIPNEDVSVCAIGFQRVAQALLGRVQETFGIGRVEAPRRKDGPRVALYRPLPPGGLDDRQVGGDRVTRADIAVHPPDSSIHDAELRSWAEMISTPGTRLIIGHRRMTVRLMLRLGSHGAAMAPVRFEASDGQQRPPADAGRYARP